jgi:hypothetical protein
VLIHGEVPDSLAERTSVNGADHLAEDLCCLTVQRDLRVEAGSER